MKMLRYPVLLLLAMLLVGCDALGGGPPPPTVLPFARHTGQDVLNQLAGAGLSVQNPQRDINVGRGTPSSFKDRYTFEIDTVAPAGGQVLVFDTPEALAEWQAYIEHERSDSLTRRGWSYVYVHNNVILQVNADLTPDVARTYRDALETLG
jgi:hypothetical protein